MNEQMKMNKKKKILKMQDKYDIGRYQEKERLDLLRSYIRSFPSLNFEGGKKVPVERVMKLGDIKSGKTKSLRGRTKAAIVLKMFFPNREDKKVYKRLERIRTLYNASKKVKQSLNAVAAFQFGKSPPNSPPDSPPNSPPDSPPNSPPNSSKTLLIPTSKNAGIKNAFPHPKPPAESSNVLKIRSTNVMNRLSNTKSR